MGRTESDQFPPSPENRRTIDINIPRYGKDPLRVLAETAQDAGQVTIEDVEEEQGPQLKARMTFETEARFRTIRSTPEFKALNLMAHPETTSVDELEEQLFETGWNKATRKKVVGGYWETQVFQLSRDVRTMELQAEGIDEAQLMQARMALTEAEGHKRETTAITRAEMRTYFSDQL